MTNQATSNRPTNHSHKTSPAPQTPATERAVDEMLARHLLLGRGGLYSEKQFRRKIRDEEKRLSQSGKASLGTDWVDALVESAINELIDAAGLSAIQEIIYRLSLAGFRCGRMAKMLGIEPELLISRLRSARRKIRAAYRDGKYAGWQEVYLSEVNRTVYRRRGR